MSGLVNKDYSKIEKLTEKRFFKNLQEKSADLNKFQMKYTPASVEETSKSSYLIDNMLVKGVKFNRDENDTNHDYMYVDTHESIGLRFYLHKYFLGFHPYYMEIKNEDYFKKERDSEIPLDKEPMIDVMKSQDEFRDIYFRQRKQIMDRSLSVVMRSTFLVRDFGTLEAITGPESLFDPSYSGNHIVLFECQLKTPPSMALIDNDDIEYFKM